MTGQGIQAVVNNHEVKIGRASFVSAEEIETSNTAIYVTIDRSFAGTILFSDQIRPEAAKTIKELRKLDVKNLMMITGDGSAIAQTIAEKVQLDSVHARSLPQDKLTILESIPKDQRPVAMVGDGVNDAPALAAADIGIAMGAHGSTVCTDWHLYLYFFDVNCKYGTNPRIIRSCFARSRGYGLYFECLESKKRSSHFS